MVKVLTVKQPWASLIAYNYKHYEFRSWKTNYRGYVYIHAGLTLEKVYKDLLEISKSGKVENPYRYFGLRKDGEK